MENEERDISIWVPVFAAIIASLVSIIATLAISSRSDYVTTREQDEYNTAATARFVAIETQLSGLDNRVQKIEGLEQPLNNCTQQRR